MLDVLLVCMPFGPVFSPSIALSLLKAGLKPLGIPVAVRYFSIDFAELVGQDFYMGIARDGRPSVRELAGEWIFSGALFDAAPADEARYVEEILRQRGSWTTRTWARPISPALIDRILRARRRVDLFLDRCLREVVDERPRLVGFTSVFQQHVASLALARRLKQALPDTFIVFGGANCEGVMGAETVRQFPFVDAVVSGEGDLVFPELVRRVLGSESVSGLPGVRTRDRVESEFAAGAFSNAPPATRMDDLPYPDYEDYFEAFGRSRYDRDWQPGLFVETSRGCWWGERMHCTFCGLNGATMAYRSKSPRRAVDEILHLAERYPGCDLQVTDNILDMGYFKQVLPELAARRLDLGLFYETKANLKKDQVRMLRDAGIRRIQPGIESFSDSVLKLMRKGVGGLQNVQLLKWCKELGVRPYWNVLWGFPGEGPDEYARLTALVPWLTHLQPPTFFSGIRIDRFSPNFFDAERLGFADLTPFPSYQHVYRLPASAVANLAYYFNFRYREPRDVESYVRPLIRRLQAWKKAYNASDLFAVDVGEHLLIWDLRPGGREPLTVVSGLERILYRACDSVCDLRQLVQVAESNGAGGLSPGDIERILVPLVARGLVVNDGARYLALAVPLGEYHPPEAVVGKFYEIVKTLGRREAKGLVVPVSGSNGRAFRKVWARRRRPRGETPRVRRRRPLTLSPSQFSLNAQGELVIR